MALHWADNLLGTFKKTFTSGMRSNNAIANALGSSRVYDNLDLLLRNSSEKMVKGSVREARDKAAEPIVKRLREHAIKENVENAAKMSGGALIDRYASDIDKGKGAFAGLKKMMPAYQEAQKAFSAQHATQSSEAFNTFMNSSIAFAKDFVTPSTAMGGKWGLAQRAGIYMGANVGLRYLRGGSATRNPRGERDIAGIPLI